MHGRRTVVLFVLVALFTAVALPAAHASSGLPTKGTVISAQEDTGGGDDGGADEESGGAGEGEDAAEETGPVWTYQMARIVVVLLVLLVAAVALLYWRLVGRPRRNGIV